ncbi:MAG: septal ring lytic transglycosylase RlpA family protein [Proteobacteria bacterium]|nr:septal ring lytic transglycosylase RlpA family protein [Pseudomonadota bacterium]
MSLRALLLVAISLGLAACASTGPATKAAPISHVPVPKAAGIHKPRVSPYAPAQEDLSKRGDYVAGGLFRPGVSDSVPDEIPDVDAIPEPEVRDEPRARTGNRDYAVLGKQYRVLDSHSGYVEEGTASYYGNKFHGRRTSSQEVYDMYAFTAAHKTLPLPSFARVTNLENGNSVVVRINDRGPFHPGRLIDLSYAAAVKLGYRNKGSARVRVEALQPDTEAVAAIDAATTAGKKVDTLPTPNPPVANAQRIATTTPATADNRFDMHQSGRAMRADEFDAWMQSRQIRVATGKPKLLAAPVPAPVPVPAAAGSVGLPVVAATPVAGEVTLQVASFGNQQNAQHALGLLQGAAITQAQLQDADVGGKKIWRLRIGPVSEAATAELAARIVGLGFAQPQRVKY